MSRRIIIRPEAEEELAAAYRWYEDQRVGLGEAFLLSVDAAIEQLRRDAARFAPVYGDVRRFLMRRFPYSIYYLLEGETITIISVFHGSRDPKRWQERE